MLLMEENPAPLDMVNVPCLRGFPRLNWLAGFLNHQQYEGIPIIPSLLSLSSTSACFSMFWTDRASATLKVAMISPDQLP